MKKPFQLSNRITILVKDPGLNAPESVNHILIESVGREVYVKVMARISALKRVRDEVTMKLGTTLTKNVL